MRDVDRLTEDYCREIVDSLPQSVFEADETGRLTYVNRHALEAFGYTEEEFKEGVTAFQTVIPDDRARALEYFQESLQGKSPGHEYTMIRKDGTTFPAIIYSSPIVRDGRLTGLRGLIVDIAERKATEQALRDNEYLLRSLVDNMLDATLIIDWDGTILFGNNAAAALVGLESPESGRGLNITDFLHPEHTDAAFEHLEAVKGGKEGFFAEYKVVAVTGEERWVEGLGSKIHLSGRSVDIVTLRDATARKQAEDGLREALAQYQKLFENAVEGIFQTSPRGRFVSVNPSLARMMGFASPQEMIHAFTDIGAQHYVVPEDRNRFCDHLARFGVVNGFETQVYRKDKSVIWVSISAMAVLDKKGEVQTYEGTVEDITERKQAAESLRALEELESSILSAIPHAVFGVRQRTIIFANVSVEMVFGWKPRELIGKDTRILYRTDEEYEEIGRRFYSVLESNRFYRDTFPCRHKDGRDILCMISTARIGNGLNEKKIVAIFEDTTEHRRAVAQLMESEERYRVAIEHSNDGVAIVKDSVYQYVNQRFVDLFGYEDAESIVGKEAQIVVHPDDRYKVIELCEARKHEPVNAPRRFEFQGVKRNGEIILVEASVTDVAYRGEQVFLAYLRDITEHKRTEVEKGHLEAQLRQAQKMEAIGQLAGGMAHDFNNILTAIIGYGNLLQNKMGRTNPFRSYVEQILSSAGKAANLTQSLLAFGRKQIIELRPCKIGAIIKNVEKLLKRLLTEDIELRIRHVRNEPTVMADVTQIDQVLINLCTNARDAMPQGGVLTIEISEEEIDSAFVTAHGYGAMGTYVCISVTDTGTGMDVQTREKIFDPFFTTKEVGKGTGLGLSIVYGVVKQHNGYIKVESQPRQGTAFRIYLPVVKMREEPNELSNIIPLGGTETILIGEDNEVVRGLAREVLEQAGYHVLEAQDGEDTIAKFRQFAHEINLVILDVVMPKKNGREVCDAIRSVKSNMKVLFTSGYAADVLLDKGICEENIDYIPKPLTPGELLGKVREALDRE